ncbi:hypothetical protein M0802_011250 [Mischocyttarus mexicanus]|nr:hypothetical protein M0802_011250 [Mischocyttarus mexicanus]
MPVTRVPILINPDGGGCDLNDDLNHSNISSSSLSSSLSLSSEQCYEANIHCDNTVTPINNCSPRDINQGGYCSRKRKDYYPIVTFLRINMRAAIIGVIGVLVIQFAGTLGISNKGKYTVNGSSGSGGGGDGGGSFVRSKATVERLTRLKNVAAAIKGRWSRASFPSLQVHIVYGEKRCFT